MSVIAAGTPVPPFALTAADASRVARADPLGRTSRPVLHLFAGGEQRSRCGAVRDDVAARRAKL